MHKDPSKTKTLTTLYFHEHYEQDNHDDSDYWPVTLIEQWLKTLTDLMTRNNIYTESYNLIFFYLGIYLLRSLIILVVVAVVFSFVYFQSHC